MKKRFLNICAALFALTVLCSVTVHAADNVYAILYDDGTFVFQYGNTPESGKTVTKTYMVDLNAVYTWDFDALSADTPWYNKRESVRVVNFADKISPTATAYWFCECKNLERVDNIQNLNTTNVTSMASMFDNCSGLTTLDVTHFDTANVTDMQYMFSGCSGLTALDVTRFDTANVTDMRHMFSGCSTLTALDVTRFDTANVTDMYSMFSDCSGLTTLDVTRFDTANVTSMEWMFQNCSGLKVLDLFHFNTAKVTSTQEMFDGCINLETIYTSDKFTIASVTAGYWMFKNCTSLVGGNGTKYDSNHIHKEYARIDTPSAPGYFTEPETHIITSYAGEGGTVTPAGDTRVSVGGSQKYVMTPNPGYRVRSVHIDGAEIGTPSEYVFQKVIRDHNLAVYFERLPRYAITAAVADGGQLSVSLENDGAVTVAVWYAGQNGQFLSVDMKPVSANAGSVTFALPFAYKARVALFDSGFRPLCDPVTVR